MRANKVSQSDDVDVLMAVDLKKVSDVPFKGRHVNARIAKVIDGDTVKVVIMMGDCPFMLSVRVLGVDCPESTKRNAKSPTEMLAGKAITKHVSDMLPVGSLVTVILTKKDMYCRFDGDITFTCSGTRISLASYLIENKLAKRYAGDKKDDWYEADLKAMIAYCNK